MQQSLSSLLISSAIYFSIALSGVVYANIAFTMIVKEVNRRHSDKEQFSYFGFTPAKAIRILGKYGREYPDGKLLLFTTVSLSLSAGFILAFLHSIFRLSDLVHGIARGR